MNLDWTMIGAIAVILVGVAYLVLKRRRRA